MDQAPPGQPLHFAYAPVPGANDAEMTFAAWAMGQGWQVTKRGWPDFICRRGDEIMCVEVKNGADTLSGYQQLAARDLVTHGIPVFEWRPPDPYADPPGPQDGQLRPACDIHQVMLRESLPASAAAPEVLAAADRAIADADRAIADAENARRQAEASSEHALRALSASEARVKTARERLRAAQSDYDKLAADAGYLLRRILDCRRHSITTRTRALMRRYGENLRADFRRLPGDQVATVTPSGTGWPAQ